VGLIETLKRSARLVAAEVVFQRIVKNLARGGLTAKRLEEMAQKDIGLLDLLTEKDLDGVRSISDREETKLLAQASKEDRDYLVGLITEVLPQHGVVLANNPKFAVRLTEDLEEILFGQKTVDKPVPSG